MIFLAEPRIHEKNIEKIVTSPFAGDWQPQIILYSFYIKESKNKVF